MGFTTKFIVENETKTLEEQMFAKLTKFNRFKVTFKGRNTLIIGGVFFCRESGDIIFKQDIFKDYPYSLTKDDEDKSAIINVQWSDRDNTMTIQRTDGYMFIFCDNDSDSVPYSVDIDIMDCSDMANLVSSELIDSHSSRQIGERIFYVIDFFRLKSLDTNRNFLKIYERMADDIADPSMTLSVAFELLDDDNNAASGETCCCVQFCLWDMALCIPVQGD